MITPRKNPKFIPVEKRISYLREQKNAGVPFPGDIQNRLRSFFLYQMSNPQLQGFGDCYVCQKPAERWHHVIPMKRSGSDAPRNVVTLCKSCAKKVSRHTRVRSNRRKKPYVHVPVLLKPKSKTVFVPKTTILQEFRENL